MYNFAKLHRFEQKIGFRFHLPSTNNPVDIERK